MRLAKWESRHVPNRTSMGTRARMPISLRSVIIADTKSGHRSDEPIHQGSEFRLAEPWLNRFKNFQGNPFELSLASFFYVEMFERERYPPDNIRKLFSGQLRAYRVSDVPG